MLWGQNENCLLVALWWVERLMSCAEHEKSKCKIQALCTFLGSSLNIAGNSGLQHKTAL